MTPSQRPTREWPLLILTLALVGMIVYPLWQTYASNNVDSWFTWTPEQIGRASCRERV